MSKEFIIEKQSGTYSETLEAFGVANLVTEILMQCSVVNNVTIEDKSSHYLVASNVDITEDMLKELHYFQIFKFILKDGNQPVPADIVDYFDYPRQKGISDNYKNRSDVIEKNKLLTIEQKKIAKQLLNEEKNGEFGQKIDPEFDVYREIKGNPYPSFLKLFDNFYQNKQNFQSLISEILNYYTHKISPKRGFKLIEERPTALQLYNPNQGKGLNEGKANNAGMGSIKSNWIAETMKISGSLAIMICQYVKVGSGYDMKIFVPEFNQINLLEAKSLLTDFKKNLKSVSPIKLDILNIINFSIKFIQRTPEYNKGKLKKTIKGFHSVYQKDLGQNKAVANISFIATPDFIEYSTKQEGREWIENLEHQRYLIGNIDEKKGDAIQGLICYRTFLGSIGNSAMINFNKFSFWYSGYLMKELSGGNKYIKPFKIELLTKYYLFMQPDLSEIIDNEGFKAVAKAVRNSTIRLQIQSKFQETHKKFQIRYGLAQYLGNKSKSKIDFTIFIGEFLAKYDSETAKHKENNPGIVYRSNVRDDEKDKFFKLLDIYPSKLVGALLASFGFALERFDATDENKLQKILEEATKLGYELVKIDEQSQSLEGEPIA